MLDFETTNLIKGSPLVGGNRIVLACWTCYKGDGSRRTTQCGKDNHRNKSARANEFSMGELIRDITEAAFVVAHNSKFELGWLKRCGLDLTDIIVFDTMVAEYVLGGNRFHVQHLGLDACLSRHELPSKLSTVGMMLKAGIPTEDIPEEWLLSYCTRDVEATGELFLKQRALLRERGLEATMYHRCLVTPALTDMEFNGMQLDTEAVLQYEDKQEARYRELTTKLQRFCGGASPSSPPQMREFIFNKLRFKPPLDYRGRQFLTGGGELSTDKEVMARLRPSTARQRAFLQLRGEWSGLHSELTKYIRKFGECSRVADGQLHAVFNQCNTRTHRLSSSGHEYGVQFQNFNRAFKPLFMARNKGWYIAESDGAQLEFRVATHLGRDRVGLQDIYNGEDVHRYTASIINGVPEDEVTKDQRTDAKSDTFKPLFGGESGTPQQRKYYEAFREKYPSITKTQRGWAQTVLRDKCLVTESGLIYYWPHTKLTSSGYITESTKIYNAPVQGLATAEIIPIALVCAWHRMQDMKSFLINTVHDSIIAEVSPDETEEWEEISKQCLIDDVYDLLTKLYNVHLTVPLGVESTISDRWGVGKGTTYEAPESLWLAQAQQEGMI